MGARNTKRRPAGGVRFLNLERRLGGADRDRTDDLLNAIRRSGVWQSLRWREKSIFLSGLRLFRFV